MNTRANVELCRTCVDCKECRSGGKPRSIPLAHCTNKDGVMQRTMERRVTGAAAHDRNRLK